MKPFLVPIGVPDADDRRRALDTATSFIVQAPAGSGKTELLMQRFLALLAEADQPENIVALTFTLKAAAEMRSRILRALRNAADGEVPEAEHLRVSFNLAQAALEQDRRKQWDLQASPQRLRIMTIDALNLAIASQAPWTSRLGGAFQPEENPQHLYLEAALSTLQMVDDDTVGGQIQVFLRHIDNQVDRGLALLANLLQKRDQWLRHTGSGRYSDEEKHQIRSILERDLVTLRLEALQSVVDSLTPALRKTVFEVVDPLIDPPRQMEGDCDSATSSFEWWVSARAILLTQAGTVRKRPDPALRKGSQESIRMERLLADLGSIVDFAPTLRRLEKLPDAEFTPQQWDVVAALLTILPIAVAQLEALFQQRGTVDFSGIAQAAARALGSVDNPTDLSLLLGDRIQHLLIDEFQDTSLAQWELLQLLTASWEPRDQRQTLFLVGDPMQSIYRFRQAEVGLFQEAKRYGVRDIVLEPLQLTANFRSNADVVEWNNETFARVFESTSDTGIDGIPFHASAPVKSARTQTPVLLHLDHQEREEAAIVAQLLSEIPAEESVAILARTRAHLAPIIQRLHQDRVAFQAVDIERLSDRPVVQDLHALTRALYHFGDRTAWLALLRGPWGLGFEWGGATLPELVILAAPEGNISTVWDSLLWRVGRLPEPRRTALEKLIAILEELLRLRGRIPVAELLERAWNRLDGQLAYPEPAHQRDAARMLQLLATVAPGAVLLSFSDLAGRIDALFAEPDLTAGDRVQIMTIHKAKGLEFDRVIVVGLGRAQSRGDDDLIVFDEQVRHTGAGLMIAVRAAAGQDGDRLFSYVRSLDRRREVEESKRLLYVAATRAKRHLHLIGSMNNGKPRQDSLLARLIPKNG